MPEEEKQENKYQETVLTKWIFRIGAVLVIMFFCFIIIRFEFRELAENQHARDSAERMVDDIERASENLQDAWNTIYYFYQTGDLFRIMRCPSVMKSNTSGQEDTLLVFYREDIETQQTTDNSDITADFRDVKSVRCGGNITINIGLKKEIHKHPKDSKNYTFKLGEEPLELLEKYPFVKDALTRLRFGEKATFVALPVEKKIFKPKKNTIYEMSIPNLPSTEVTNVPLHMFVNKSDEKFSIVNHVVCGSIVYFLFKITDISGNVLVSSRKMEKIKIGSGLFNDYIEQIMTRMRVGDRCKILLTKKMFHPTDILNNNIMKNNDIVVVDIVIANVQR